MSNKKGKEMHLVTTAEYCRVFGCAPKTPHNRAAAGTLECVLVPGRLKGRYLWDIQKYCQDNGICWKTVKEILEFKRPPSALKD